MITSLRTKIRPDNLRTQVRSGGRSVARRLYLGAVVILFSFLLYYSAGGYFLLEADGLVASARTEVAPMLLARVINVHVKPTQQVKTGDMLVSVQEPEAVLQFGQAQARLADLIRRDDQIRSRQASIRTLIPLASSYSAKAAKYDTLASGAGTRGFASTAHLAGTARDAYNAARDLSLLQTEEQALRDEMVTQDKLRGEVTTLIEQLRDIYHNGHIYAPIDGRVGAYVPDRGQVFRAGDPILGITTGVPYVLAYVPTARTYALEDGQQVVVTDGARRVLGNVVRLSNQGSIAATLPKDFQSVFRAPDIREVFRVELKEASPFALYSKVRVVNPASPANVTAMIVAGIRSVFDSIPWPHLGEAAKPERQG